MDANKHNKMSHVFNQYIESISKITKTQIIKTKELTKNELIEICSRIKPSLKLTVNTCPKCLINNKHCGHKQIISPKISSLAKKTKKEIIDMSLFLGYEEEETVWYKAKELRVREDTVVPHMDTMVIMQSILTILNARILFMDAYSAWVVMSEDNGFVWEQSEDMDYSDIVKKISPYIEEDIIEELPQWYK